MFNNLININDFTVLLEKASQKGIGRVASKIFRTENGRVKRAWNSVNGNLTHWWDIPAVSRRLNLKMTGNEDIRLVDYVKNTFFSDNKPISGLSIGCGTGIKEIQWVQSMQQLSLHGIDLSQERIQQAMSQAKQLGLENRLTFKERDIYSTTFKAEQYDLIIFDSSLHHFSPVGHILEDVSLALKPNGLLIVNEYVGPARFQWTDDQLEKVNTLLEEIPEAYRKKISSNSVKKKVYRPGIFSMYVSDPSEAVESDIIEEELVKRFTVVEKKDCGGTILHLLFKDIAGNFIRNDEGTKKLLQHIFEIEDRYLMGGEIDSDFKLFIARQKGFSKN